MENEITEEEYSRIIERLNDIKQEYQSLQEMGLAVSFEELLINIQRDNFNIDKEINRSIKLFFSEMYLVDEKIKEQLKTTIQFLIADIENKELNEEVKEPIEVTSISAHFPKFQILYGTIKDELERKKANNFLKNYVETLLEEESHLQSQKRQYEKKQKGSKFKKLMLEFKKTKKEKGYSE